MKEERKKISLKEKLTVSKIRLWGGFIISLLLSFSVYLFFTSIRDLYRLFSLTEDLKYLKFTSEELQFYNLFYALLSLLIGLHFYCKISLDTNRKFLSNDIMLKNYNMNLFNHINFYKEYKFIFILIILVLLSQSLMTTMITFKTKIKIVLLLVLFAFLFSQFNLIDIEALITKMKSK